MPRGIFLSLGGEKFKHNVNVMVQAGTQSMRRPLTLSTGDDAQLAKWIAAEQYKKHSAMTYETRQVVPVIPASIISVIQLMRMSSRILTSSNK